MNKTTNFLCLSLLLLGATALGMNNLEEQLIEATRTGDLKKVKSLIAQGVSIETKNRYGGQTPLICAASFDCEDVCKFLIMSKASLEARDYDRKTQLLCAVKYQSANACKLLIANKASLEVVDIHGRTPLMLTVRGDILRFTGPNHETMSKKLNDAQEAMGKLLIDAQLEPALHKIAAIVTFLGLAKKGRIKSPCHMPLDIAKIIARQASKPAQKDKWLVIGQITKQISELENPAKTKWLAYLDQHKK